MTEKKKQRKFILIALLALIVIVTAALIGTLARYMTLRTVSDDAVVANFGLNIPNSINLFSDSYTNVQADTDGKKIIAPGTSGQYSFKVTGTSEVAYRVSANISVVYSEEWNGYAPLKFSIDGINWTDFEEFKENLRVALERETMQPNEEYANTQTIYWEWPFFTSSGDDIRDTEMGAAAAAGTAPKVTVSVEVTAAQID